MKRTPLELVICFLLYVAACMALLIAAPRAHGQPVVYAPPVQYAVVGYQPVVMPGYWMPVPRPTRVGNALFGPRYYFFPVQRADSARWPSPPPIAPPQQAAPQQ